MKTDVALSPGIQEIRKDFPILSRQVNGKPLVYLDNAATTQKPTVVLDAIQRYYREENANIHRGVHKLAEVATASYEDARRKVAASVGARPEELIFTRGATEALNLVAYAWARRNLKPNDEVLITRLEHHSNIVPWQLICAETGATLRYVELTPDLELNLEDVDRKLTDRTRIFSFTQMSNVLGTMPPVETLVEKGREAGALVVVDGAQGASHLGVDVKELDCDFYAFSAHKMFGPTGIGALYGRYELLDAMEPFLCGGEMIGKVMDERSTWAEVPHKFEAGTMPIAQAVGFGAAVDYVTEIGFDRIHAHEVELAAYALERMGALPEVTLYGSRNRGGVVSFSIENIHPHDIATVLDYEGIAVRAGHHCAQHLMRSMGVGATARASFAIYNTKEEIDKLIEGLKKVIELFS